MASRSHLWGGMASNTHGQPVLDCSRQDRASGANTLLSLYCEVPCLQLLAVCVMRPISSRASASRRGLSVLDGSSSYRVRSLIEWFWLAQHFSSSASFFLYYLLFFNSVLVFH
ncbi:hypothetical protein V2G26_016469 [Clonostachys chloroleuca]